jgi:23S rRNA (uracil1939-C5)-methyltransferase
MGHYARASRRVVPVHECPVHDERGNRLSFRLYDEYRRARIAAAGTADSGDRRDGAWGRDGVLRSVAVRVAARTGEIMTTLVVTGDADKRLRTATRTALGADAAPTSLHLNLHPRGGAFIFGSETRRLAGSDRLRDDVAGSSFLMSPTAFFQTNTTAAELLVQLVLDALTPGARVLDVYAGGGLFALPMARRGHEVIAIEENRAAVADGEASLRLNHIPAGRCRFVARRAEAALESIRKTDAVVLDPPRDGCSRPVLEAVFGRLRPSRAIYISCNPEALGRDLTTITTFGYRVVSVQPVDMFPHTAHIETVVLVTRGEGG